MRQPFQATIYRKLLQPSVKPQVECVHGEHLKDSSRRQCWGKLESMGFHLHMGRRRRITSVQPEEADSTEHQHTD
jgi:hypothetical protein